jgi:rhodanese-related sulfurtransferase
MRPMRILATAFILILFVSSASFAQYPIIDSQQLKTWMTGKKKAVLIDSRTPEEYLQAHIPGAISIPADKMRTESRKLPKDKNTPLIFYCRGLGCTLSPMAAGQAMEMGYTYLMIYQAGMPDWLLQGNPIQKGDKPGTLKHKKKNQ